MSILDNIKDGANSLRINKIRLALPLLSIMFGVAALILTTSVVEGEKRFISKEIEKLGAKLVSVSMRDMEISTGFTPKDIEAIKRRSSEIKQIIPLLISSSSIYAFNKSVEGAQIGGTVAELKEVTSIPLIMGRFFTPEEVNNLSNICVIGKGIYNRLFRKQAPIGQSLCVVRGANQKINLRIVGVLDKINNQIPGMIRDEGIFVPITLLQKRIAGRGNICSLLVETYSSEGVTKAVQDIKMIFGFRKIPVVVYAPRELLYAHATINRKATIWGYSLGILLLIVGGIGIMNIMVKSVLERTREIGIRKAVGAKNRDILTQFLVETTIIGLSSCFAGITVGVISTHITSEILKLHSPIISIGIISLSCTVALLESLLFGLYPAYKASKFNPIDALRYE